MSSVADAVQHAGPYARPVSAVFGRHAVDAVLIDAIRANVGPYIPAAWRENAAAAGAMVVESLPTELPWIETFLESTPASLIAVEEALPLAIVESPLPAEVEAVEAALDDASVDEWPLYETGAALRELANDLDGPPPAVKTIAIEPSLAFGFTANELASASTAGGDHPAHALPMWNDDDMMDIMPATTSPEVDAIPLRWAEQARNETAPSANSEAAAQVLEALAKRVRDGELMIPGHTATMGDAATLAGALAALLGARH